MIPTLCSARWAESKLFVKIRAELREFGEKSFDGILRELAAVKRRGRQLAKRRGDLLGRNLAGLGKRSSCEQFGEKRTAGNRSHAAAGLETGFGDAPVFQANGKLEDVAASGIADFNHGRCAGKLSGIAGVLEVLENSGAIHAKEYPKPAAYTQRPPDARPFFFANESRFLFCRRHVASTFLREIFFLDGSDHDVVRVHHFGQMDARDFGKEFVGIKIR